MTVKEKKKADEIEITPEMIEAGAKGVLAVLCDDLVTASGYTTQAIAEKVLRTAFSASI